MSKSVSKHLFRVAKIPWTEQTPTRVKVFSELHRQSVIIDFDTNYGNDACEIAEHWLQSKGFIVTGHAEGKNCMYVISDTFTKPRK